MEGRPDTRPGAFKRAANQAGLTVFVAPDLVPGTLAQGLRICRSLETPFQRPVFMMFLIAEVHPFADGNGRVARIMMNAELAAAGEERIIVPTVYRANYLSALKALSQTGRPEPLRESLRTQHSPRADKIRRTKPWSRKCDATASRSRSTPAWGWPGYSSRTTGWS